MRASTPWSGFLTSIVPRRELHPDIVSELCDLCPDLLEDLLDGMLWHSASVEAGQVGESFLDFAGEPCTCEGVLCGLGPVQAILMRRQVRVNYYVRELYGDPEHFQDAWEAPIAIMAMKAPAKLFVHPAMEKVRSANWCHGNVPFSLQFVSCSSASTYTSRRSNLSIIIV